MSDGYLVSERIPDRDTSCLGLRQARSPGLALDQARQLLGPDATVLVLREAPRVVPRH